MISARTPDGEATLGTRRFKENALCALFCVKSSRFIFGKKIFQKCSPQSIACRLSNHESKPWYPQTLFSKSENAKLVASLLNIGIEQKKINRTQQRVVKLGMVRSGQACTPMTGQMVNACTPQGEPILGAGVVKKHDIIYIVLNKLFSHLTFHSISSKAASLQAPIFVYLQYAPNFDSNVCRGRPTRRAPKGCQASKR